MAVTITIPTALRQYAGGNASLTLDADTVGALLRGLVETYPDLGRHLYTEQGNLRNFVNVYVGDEDIRYLNGEETELRDGETVSIIPAIAGGSPRSMADAEQRQAVPGRAHRLFVVWRKYGIECYVEQ